jgi:predicted RNA binding protein YcfA (HicA-like mRNA interferase family)
MTPLPVISGPDCVRCLEKAGFVVVRQKGSHIRLRRSSPYAQLVVPNHKELDRGTLRAIIRQADMSAEEFVRLL